MNRFSAFAIHLGISLLIFVVLAYLIVFEWYPGFFFDTDGGWRGMRIIIAVDLVLGPMLTLVVYKAGKPGLKTDLTLIGLFQFVCLFAGTYVVYSERPVSVVFVDGRFAVLSTDDYTEDAGIAVPDLATFPGDDPKWVMVVAPQGIEAEARFRAEAFAKGSLNHAVEHYQAFDREHWAFLDNAMDLSVVRERQDGDAAIAAWLAAHGGTTEDYGFYLFTTRYVYKYAGFRRADGEMLGFLDVRPP